MRNDNTFKLDHHYVGRVTGAHWTSAKSGNVGFTVDLTCEDGNISYTIWATPKNRDNCVRDFAVLGISEDQLANSQYVDSETFIQDVTGREVTFRLAEEEYNGRSKLKVLGIGKPVADISSRLAQALGLNAKPVTITDEDIPF